MATPAPPQPLRSLRATTLAALALTALAACATGPEPLMETPVLYHDGALDPFAHLTDAHRSTALPVFYATKRAPRSGGAEAAYGTRMSRSLHLGTAQVHFGEEGLTWEDLHAASLDPQRPAPIPLELGPVTELATLDRDHDLSRREDLTGEQREFLAQLDARLAHAQDPELVVYVHGAKVDFYRCCVRAAELNHFAGRDLVSVVFDWPSHPNIFSYVWGSDRRRALESADDLRALIELLAHSQAQRIHVICYSAGAIVTSEALVDLHRHHAAESVEQAREKLRLGVVLFAASDLPVEHFLEEVDAIHELAERVCVTVSDGDNVLDMAPRWMGGGQRLGLRGEELPEAEQRTLAHLPRLEVVDVSYGKEERGFDIVGHHYWYRHPWSSSDVILNVRTDLPPDRRGLGRTEAHGVWHLPSDYPESARRAVRDALDGAW